MDVGFGQGWSEEDGFQDKWYVHRLDSIEWFDSESSALQRFKELTGTEHPTAAGNL